MWTSVGAAFFGTLLGGITATFGIGASTMMSSLSLMSYRYAIGVDVAAAMTSSKLLFLSVLPASAVDAISILEIEPVWMAIDLLLYGVLFYTISLFVAGCEFHFLMMGNSTVRVTMSIPENFPVIEYIDAEEMGPTCIKIVKDAYERASEYSNQLVGTLTKLLEVSAKAYGVPGFIIRWVREWVVNYLVHKVIDESLQKVIAIIFAMKSYLVCFGTPSGWKLAYVGSLTFTPEAIAGPNYSDVTVAFTYNPLYAFAEELSEKPREYYKKAKEMVENLPQLLIPLVAAVRAGVAFEELYSFSDAITMNLAFLRGFTEIPCTKG